MNGSNNTSNTNMFIIETVPCSAFMVFPQKKMVVHAHKFRKTNNKNIKNVTYFVEYVKLVHSICEKFDTFNKFNKINKLNINSTLFQFIHFYQFCALIAQSCKLTVLNAFKFCWNYWKLFLIYILLLATALLH